MKPSTLLAAAALLALAACDQATTTTSTTTAAAPTDMKGRVEAMDELNQPVFAMQQVSAYLTAHPDAGPACVHARHVQSQGVVPANVAPNTPYSALAGQLVFSVQCGEQRTTVHDDPKQHWLVAFAPGAQAANVLSCADAHGADQCPHEIPTTAAATTATTTTTP
ncbi:MAG: hypothetical protein QM759_14525 [Terricaulis sp.]